MMERQVLVVSTGGREGFAMVRGIRSAGVFCVQTQAGAKLEIPEETRGAVVIGAADDAVRSSIDALRAKGLPVLALRRGRAHRFAKRWAARSPATP